MSQLHASSLDCNKTVAQSPFHHTVLEVSQDRTGNYNLPIVHDSCGIMSDITCDLVQTPDTFVQENEGKIVNTREQMDFTNTQSVLDERYTGDNQFYSEDSKAASSIYPCGICHRACNDELTIQCESGCFSWFHKVCTGLSDAAFMLLTGEDFAEWICDKCISTKNIPFIKVKN